MVEIEIANSLTVPKKSPKEMLSLTWEKVDYMSPDRPVFKINFSSLDLIQTCKRKAQFVLNKSLTSNEESSATLFGSAVHKALEAWYSSDKKARKLRSSDCYEAGCGWAENHEGCARCVGLYSFLEAAKPLLGLDLSDKRHPYNGLKILNVYFDKYLDDPFEVYCDDKGPVIERRFEFTLINESKLKVIYFGTIDAVLRNIETNTILVADHKTTSALGSEFYNRLKPNHQYTGYVMGANRALGIDTNLFLVNGIQVAKTKCDLARQITQRDEEDFQSLTEAVRFACDDYLKCLAQQVWPQTAPGPCTQWGGCQFRPICEVPKILQNNVIEAMYQNAGR